MGIVNFIVLVIAFFTSLLFIINIIADIVGSDGFDFSEEANKQRILNAKYRLVLAAIMSVAWPYVILFI
jgi:hypothetical protein